MACCYELQLNKIHIRKLEADILWKTNYVNGMIKNVKLKNPPSCQPGLYAHPHECDTIIIFHRAYVDMEKGEILSILNIRI